LADILHKVRDGKKHSVVSIPVFVDSEKEWRNCCNVCTCGNWCVGACQCHEECSLQVNATRNVVYKIHNCVPIIGQKVEKVTHFFYTAQNRTILPFSILYHIHTLKYLHQCVARKWHESIELHNCSCVVCLCFALTLLLTHAWFPIKKRVFQTYALFLYELEAWLTASREAAGEPQTVSHH
jgi:hypothetical protein